MARKGISLSHNREHDTLHSAQCPCCFSWCMSRFRTTSKRLQKKTSRNVCLYLRLHRDFSERIYLADCSPRPVLNPGPSHVAKRQARWGQLRSCRFRKQAGTYILPYTLKADFSRLCNSSPSSSQPMLDLFVLARTSLEYSFGLAVNDSQVLLQPTAKAHPPNICCHLALPNTMSDLVYASDPETQGLPRSSRLRSNGLATLVSKFEILDALSTVQTPNSSRPRSSQQSSPTRLQDTSPGTYSRHWPSIATEDRHGPISRHDSVVRGSAVAERRKLFEQGGVSDEIISTTMAIDSKGDLRVPRAKEDGLNGVQEAHRTGHSSPNPQHLQQEAAHQGCTGQPSTSGSLARQNTIRDGKSLCGMTKGLGTPEFASDPRICHRNKDPWTSWNIQSSQNVEGGQCIEALQAPNDQVCPFGPFSASLESKEALNPNGGTSSLKHASSEYPDGIDLQVSLQHTPNADGRHSRGLETRDNWVDHKVMDAQRPRTLALSQRPMKASAVPQQHVEALSPKQSASASSPLGKITERSTEPRFSF